MKVKFNWLGRDVVDLELHIWSKPPPPAPAGPTLRANGGGSSERASNFGDPMTISGFGFQA